MDDKDGSTEDSHSDTALQHQALKVPDIQEEKKEAKPASEPSDNEDEEPADIEDEGLGMFADLGDD